eukprot:7490956-Pyramimonas_sp.AAC.1
MAVLSRSVVWQVLHASCRMVSPSAGVTMCLGSGFRESHVVRQWHAGAELAGRGLGIRLKRKGMGIA